MASDSDDDYSLLNLDDGKDSSVGQTVSPASPESAGGSPSQRAPAQTLQSNLSLILGHGEQDPQAGVQALSPQHSHVSQKPPAMENPSSSSDSATDTIVSNLALILSGEGPAEAEADVMQDSPQPRLHSGSEPPAVENPPRSSDSATDAKVSNKTVNLCGEGPAEAEMNVRQDSPQLQLHSPSDSDEDVDGGPCFSDEARDERNLTDSDLTDDETHPVAVATASGGGVVLTFTTQPGTTEDDETSRPSPVHKENTEESSVRGSVKDIIKAFESTGSREPRPPPAVPFPAPPSPPQQGDGDGSDTEEDHTPISASEPCDKAYDDDRDKAYDDEESVQDFSLLADSDPRAAENVALGTPEVEEEKGELESKGPTDQDGMMKMSTPLSSDSEDDVSEECGKTEEEEAVAQGFLTPDEASSPAGGQANVSKDAEEEDAADDEDDHFVMAPEEHEDLHTDINVFPSTHVSPSAQKDGSPTTAQSFTEPPQVVFTDTQHEKQQHIDSPVQDTPEPVRQFHSPGFRGQGSGTPPQWQKSEGEQLSGHMMGSQRLHSPQPMYEPRHSPDVQGPVSLGDGAFRPVPQRPQQMWASQHEGLGHGHPPQHQSAAWQWQQQQFPTPPQWAHGYNPNTAAPPQQYGPGTPAYANTPRGQFSHDQQYRQQQPYRQQQQQTYQQYMQQQARQRGPAVTPTTPWGPRMQGRGRGMQHGLTSAGHGQPFHAPPGGFQTPDVSLGASTPTKSPKVCVRGVDASTDLELLQLYFESPRKSGGDSISDVSDHRQQGYIVLTFEDPAVVNRVLERPHTVAHKTLSVSLHQEEPQAEETPDASRKVEVRGGSIVTEADMMELYFESKKSGGGPIERVEVDENAGVAVITFEDASTAAEVLKRSHKFSGTSLTVTPYQPPSPSATIKVSGLKRSVSEDLIQLYFENGRIGGGDVTEVKLNSEEGEALVTFVDPAVIPNILKRNHTIAKSAVTVTLATTTPTKISSEKSTKASVPTPASDPSTVEVTGLSANTTEETLQYYFENKRRSGGGMVKNLDFDPDTGVAKITFEDAEAAKRVLEKQHKLDGKQITVSIYRSAAPVKTSPKSSGTDSSGLNIVAVRGFKRSVSEDMLFNYFENKRRSGGGPVAEVKTDFKKGVVFITFENAEDAASVASRKQKIEGQNLEASIYRPPKMMKDHILFTGLPEIKSSDELQNFVEAKTDEEVRSILFGDEEGTAVVIFEREINFQNVQTALSKHRFLKKHTLRVEQVPVTSTILVREWAWDSPPTEDMLTNYFENIRRSSGGEVTDIELVEDQEFALVTFADTEVAARVASRKHKINGHAVDVCLFMECLGPNGGSEEPSPKLPEPLIVSDSDQQKISLLQEIPKAFEALEGALEECSAYLTQKPGNVQIACSLTTDVTGLRQQIKGWAEEAARVLQNFLQAVHVEEVEVTGEEYEEADGGLRELADENEVGMRYIGQDGKMFIIWDRPEKQQAAEKMKKILNDVKRSLSRKKMERKEAVVVPKGKLPLIQEHNIWQEIRETFPEMTVTLNTEGGFVELTGLEDETQEAKLLLLEVLNEIVSVRQDWDSDLAVQLLKSPDAQSIILAICLNADPEGRLEFASDYVEIHSFNGRRAEAMQVAARNAVQRRVIKFTNENAEVRTLSAWAELKDTLCQKNNGLMLLQEEEERLTIVSVSSTIKEDHQALKDFITQNTVQECAFDLDQPFHALLKSYLRDRQLGLPITLDDVFFDEDVGKIRVRGNRACIDAAETMYSMFCRSIVHIRKTYTQPSMKMFLQSPDWKYKCLDIEQRLQCKILEPTPELENFLVNDDSGGYGDVGQAEGRLSPEYADFLPSADDDEFVSAVQYPSGGQLSRRRGQTRSRPQAESAPARRSGVKPDIPAKPRIFLSAMSDITKEEHDVLVNSTNPGLNLDNGLVSSALLGVGGPTLQQECKTKYPQGIQMGEIAVTGPGQQDGQQKLMCKRLFHCTLPETKDVEQIKKVVKEAVTKCLTTAEELRDKEHVEIKSIGVPALGTGTLKYPPQLVAETMFEAVLEYGRQHPATRISDMNFIVYKKDETNMQVFRAEHDKYNQLKQEAQAWEKEEETSPPLVDPPSQAGVKAYKFFQDTKGKVSLMFLGLSEKTVTEAARELMECYTQKVHEVSHDVAQLEQWDDLSVKNLVSACKAVCVDVTFNFSMGRLTLCGFRENVDRIPVHDILKEAESQLRMKHNAQVMAQQIQWIYLEVDEYGEHPLPYDLYSNYKIEMAYRNNEPKVVCLDSDNVAFVIDFTTMEETPENPGDEDFVPMTVMRQDKIKESAMDAPLPDHWSDMRGEDLDAVTLKADDTEYNRVATWFMNSLKQPTAQITMIQRVQNATLYKQYMAMKKMLESSANLPAGLRLERQRMWHGTKGETKDGIIRYGFNRSYSDKNRSAYGQGAYFATEAEYSSRDAYAVANLSGERHMFLCKVLVGEYVKGDQNMRLPPEIPNSSGRLYNTTVDDDTNPTIFVTYSDVQAYPEYLIVFKDN